MNRCKEMFQWKSNLVEILPISFHSSLTLLTFKLERLSLKYLFGLAGYLRVRLDYEQNPYEVFLPHRNFKH